MSQRTDDLARREAALRLRCAVQRNDLTQQVDGLQSRLDSVDRAVITARSLLLRPAVLAGGAALILLLGRGRTFQLLGRGVVLAASLRRLARLIRF